MKSNALKITANTENKPSSTFKIVFGYCRCSTNEEKQDINRQIRELSEKGVRKENIFFEYESGTKRDREQLNNLLNKVKQGDSIVATELSRITRSTKDLCEILEIAKQKKIKMILGTFEIDCTGDTLDAMTEGMLKMMGVFAEMERNIISERVKSGMKNAKAKGSKIGRPETSIDDIPQNFKKFYELYQKGKINKSELGRLAELSRNTVNKYLKIMQDAQ